MDTQTSKWTLSRLTLKYHQISSSTKLFYLNNWYCVQILKSIRYNQRVNFEIYHISFSIKRIYFSSNIRVVSTQTFFRYRVSTKIYIKKICKKLWVWIHNVIWIIIFLFVTSIFKVKCCGISKVIYFY